MSSTSSQDLDLDARDSDCSSSIDDNKSNHRSILLDDSKSRQATVWGIPLRYWGSARHDYNPSMTNYNYSDFEHHKFEWTAEENGTNICVHCFT